MTVTIHTGDSADVLKQLPDCSVTAVVTDPPAGISFMNKGWDSDKGGPRQWIDWLTGIMAECLRVLKPGGHALVWALPRTSHWTGTALELAGFEIRDMMVHVFGTGMPKGHRFWRGHPDFCQGCDDADHTDSQAHSGAGDLRRANVRHSMGRPSGFQDDCQQGCDSDGAPPHQAGENGLASAPSQADAPGHSRSGVPLDGMVDAPSHNPSLAQCTCHLASTGCSDHAEGCPCTSLSSELSGFASNRSDVSTRAFHNTDKASETSASGPPASFPKCSACGKPNATGYNVALKPSHECWWLARKPLIGTIAENALRHGTGALDIDGCRVGTSERPEDIYNGQTGPIGGQGAYGGTKGSIMATGHADGRWPPNMLLSHHPECRQIGTTEVSGDTRAGQEPGRRPSGFADTGADNGDGRPAGKLHGKQTVPVMSCHHDCPVAELDRQSGVTGGGIVKPYRRVSDEYYSGSWPDSYGGGHDDTGGASRFFPVFRYQAKATTAERDHGVTGPERQTGFPMRSADAESNAEGGDGTKTHRQTTRRNLHPTVKSVALMRWLVTLVSSPDGTVVLDPFCGSGSTGVACVMNGVDFIGIEQSAEFADVARQRCSQAQRDSGVTAEDIKSGQAPDGPVQVKLW